MSGNIFQIIHCYLCFNDNTVIETNEGQLHKIQPILDIVINNFKSNYIPDREILLDEGMLGWWGRLCFCLYNPGKIKRYGILVCMVCKSKSRYICNMHTYDGKCVPLTETAGLLLEPYEGVTICIKTTITTVFVWLRNCFKNQFECVAQLE
jgi:hypothetical protein